MDMGGKGERIHDTNRCRIAGAGRERLMSEQRQKQKRANTTEMETDQQRQPNTEATGNRTN
jgi:hypothetical protein